MLTASQIERILPGPDGSGGRIGAGARAPALLDQHVPVVAAGASRIATSRTTARSTRCRATSTGCARARGCCSRRVFGDDLGKVLPVIRPGGSDTATFDNVLEFLVMAGRSLPHAVLMMIPEPWGGNPGHGSGGARVLRVSLLADGAVGRTGVDRLHRRHRHRRRPRSQRPAPVALLRHDRRPRDHGVGSRRPRHPGRSHRRQGSAAPRQDAADRHRAAAHHQRRRDQAGPGRRAAVRRVAAASTWWTSRICRAPTPSGPTTRPCCAGSRRSATRRRICASC